MGYYDNYDDYQRYLKDYNNSQQGGQWARNILGGPIGWIMNATGKRNAFENTIHEGLYGGIAFEEMNDRDVYESMQPGDWDAFNKMSNEERRAFMVKRKAEVGKQKSVESEQQAAADKEKENAAQRDKFRNDQIARLDAFAKEMGMPVEQLMQTDAYAKALRDQTYAQSAQGAANSGLGYGGMSAMNADQTTKNALLGYQMQRQQAGAQATQQAFNMMSQVENDAEGRRRYEQDMNMQLQAAQQQAQMRNYAEQQGKKQGLYSMAGGIIGGMYGGPTGAAFGSQLGSGLAGSTSQPYQATGYKYPTGTSARGSGGLYGNSGNSGGYRPIG